MTSGNKEFILLPTWFHSLFIQRVREKLRHRGLLRS